MAHYVVESGMEAEEVARLLAQTSWAARRSLGMIAQSMQGSANFGVRLQDGTLVGYARLVTDGCTFGYLCDVVVDEAHRGRGYAAALMSRIMAYPGVDTMRRFCLVTESAHDLYAKYGFAPIANPSRWMERFSEAL